MTNAPSDQGTLGWGWLQGTAPCGAPRLRALLVSYLGEAFDQEWGTRWYECAAKVGTRGSLIAWNPRAAPEGRAVEVFFQVVQSDCDALGIDQVAKLARELLKLGAHFTRADAFYDDRRRRVDPATVLAAFRAGRCVSHYRKSSLYDEGQDGVTAYLGSRGQSEAFIRVYDKDAEQRVKLGKRVDELPDGTHGVRWEVQARDSRAGWLVDQVLLVEGDRGPALASVLCSLVDFREREGVEHGERATRLTWWIGLVGDVERAWRHVAQVVDGIERRMRWIERQCAPTLALILESRLGDVSVLLNLCRSGAQRLTGPQRALLDDWWKQQGLAVAGGVV